MQQPVNYPCPQIYWVDSSATSPWAPPGSVFSCPSSGPRGPGQRRPPPPPPPPSPLPPPSQPPPLPPLSPLKKKDNIELWLPVIFFMVLVALVGMGLGMYQLFHLQKELAELREFTNHSLRVSSFEKQIANPSTPSETKKPRSVAHLTGNPRSRSIPLEWEDTYGTALISGVKYKKGGLVINEAGLYFVYSKVYFRGQSCNSQPLSHKVYMRNFKYPGDLVLMEEKKLNYCTTGQIWAHSSYLGAVFNLTVADHLYVNISQLSLINFEESKTFFGLYKL
ncbi:Fas ligand (TNF superfamily, member 6) [Rattus norvegicus]|uniref:Tumor necrosis factor ligand superfamily member 6 n=2 Tax=Rattus norvegicus TaxID=10116 RepID=TNFL6_RAT|nr:tumor necrosis factor ligand superfamily member 6 [Rattus norvegicus]XP_017454164.1 tumor necrosis factor ligand superfamily member 6 isoform X1 [Rattus norvegicus]P36940.1 RecName: Full=Tumor necrosis factor ligand superfamily member 6; AltName: Full=CD95 ligand; Short=CD95-L; AltName: Full=Fas antigen ligand; Short=Fas ligand; Short=FasL; AltName: CD_antigen=CD178; Contains: RecName: Full=Tumor necrosis factor ligand superfamily member 6, membrane form; Contains: RecName: Full=Tumor necrosis|eukprot:NP_037040.1 tumor necrosis factor ligand superfamily member 6 [Rattus norvegicus]